MKTETNIQRAKVKLNSLQDEPWKADFYTLLRYLEAVLVDRPKIGESTRFSEDIVSLTQALYLEFAPASIKSLTPLPDKASGPIVKLEGYFLGLTGPTGPLPLSLTEYIWSRSNGIPHPDRIAPNKREISLNRRDTSLKDFINIFNHRFISFLYRAWSASRKAVDYDRPSESKFADYLKSFINLNGKHLSARFNYPDETIIYHSGRFVNQSRHPEGLVAVVKDFFECPVELRENVGHWIALPQTSLLQLADTSGSLSLGEGLPIGSKIWDRQLKFELMLGPMSYSQYQGFLPENDDTPDSLVNSLKSMVSLYTNREFYCDVIVVLDKQELPSPKLGSGITLGFNTWLHKAAAPQHASDLIININ